MTRLVCFLRSRPFSGPKAVGQPKHRRVLAGLMLSCLLLAGYAVAQTDQCALTLSITPASPVPLGQPVTATVSRNFPAQLTVVAPVSFDGQQFCSYANTFIDPQDNTCPSAGTVFNNLSIGDHTVSWTCTVINDPVAGPPVSGSQTFTVAPPPPEEGSVNPKYLVLSVIYAPPGSQSSVDYGTSTMMGTSTDIKNGIASNTTITASLQFGPRNIEKDLSQSSITAEGSHSFTHTKIDDSSIEIDKTTTYDLTVKGPASSSQGINHDFDIILLWINPRIDLTFSTVATNRFNLQWNGYTFDPRDPANEVDVVPVYVGWLKNPSTMPSGVAAALQRSWSLPQADGSGTGLTQSDFNVILSKDPFASGTTAIDPKRFDLSGQTFSYAPPPAGGKPITEKFSLNYQATSTEGKTVSDETKYTYSVEGSASFVGIVTATFKDSHFIDITHSLTQNNTQAQGQKATLSLTGPTAGYTGPNDLQVYQDNIYGTFMFSFVPETLPGFTLSATPVSQVVVPGGSATYTVSASAFNSFSGSIALTAAGMPSGCGAVTFSPASIGGGAGSSVMTVPACSTPGNFTVTITGTSGALTNNTSVGMDVTSAPFLVLASPAAAAIAKGDTTTYTVSSTQSSSFNGNIVLSISGLPAGASGSFNPASIAGGATSVLTVTTSSSTPTGVASPTITGTSGGSQGTTTVDLVVSDVSSQSGAGCSVNVTFTPLGQVEGLPITYAATATTLAGDNVNGSVTLDGLLLCNIGSAPTTSSCSVTQNAPSTGTHAIQWTCTSSGTNGNGTGAGSQTFGVAATGVAEAGAIKPKYAVLSVIYAPPGSASTVDYSSSTALGTSSSLDKSFSDKTTTSVSLGGGFSLFKVFKAMVTFTKSKEFTQTVDTASSIAVTKTNAFDLKVPGPASGADGIDHDFDVILVWLNPTVQFTITGRNTAQWTGFGFDGNDPANEVDVVPLYVTWLKNPSTMPPDIRSALARTWADPLFDGSGPGLTGDDFLAILKRDPFTDPNYSPALSPGTTTTSDKRFDLQVGETLSYEPPPRNGQPFTETFGLNFQNTTSEGLKATDDFTVGFSVEIAADVTIPITTWLTLNFSAKASTGKDLDWTNVAAQTATQSNTQAATISLTGPGPGYTGPTDLQVFKDNIYGTFMFAFNPFSSAPAFDLWSTPDSQTVAPGGSTSYSISALSLSGFNKSVALTVSGAPAGMTTSFSPPSISGTASSVLTVNVSSSVAPATYTLTITGSNALLTDSVTVDVIVDPASFELAASPALQTTNPGLGATFTVSSIPVAGFSGNVDLTVSGVPAGVTASFAPTPISGTTFSTLTVSASSSTATGSYPLTITGTSGGITKSVTVTLVVSAAPFFLTAAPPAHGIVSGEATSYTVLSTPLGGFSGPVQLTVGGLPMGVTATVSPSSISGADFFTVGVQTSLTTQVGTYPLTFTGTGGGQQTATTADLVISEPFLANSCAVDLAFNPTVPAAGQPVTITATLIVPPGATGGAGIAFDNQMFCGASETTPCVKATNPLTGGVHTVRWSCTTGSGGTGSGSQIVGAGTAASINPKYQVLSVIYAPPGKGSKVDYGSSTQLGTTVSFSDSFSKKTSRGATLTAGLDYKIPRIIGCPPPNPGDKPRTTPCTLDTIFGLSVTATASESFAQTLQDDLSIAVSKTQSADISVPGPDIASAGINHDFDVILLWINPVVNLVITGPTSALWNGYTFDPGDPVNEVDVIPVYVAWLKDRSLMPPGVREALARTWADDPSDGSGRGLTDADFANILARDTFATGLTDVDPARFVLTGETFAYAAPPNGGQPITEQLALSYQVATAQSQSVKDTYTVGYALKSAPETLAAAQAFLHDNILKTDKLNIGPVTVSTNADASITLSNTAKRQNTQKETQTATLSLAGPAAGYTGPTDLQVYRDSVYGTFLFSFVPTTTFHVSTTAPSQTTSAGGSASYPVSLTSFSGFTGPVVFSTSGLPQGASSSFSPSSLATDGSTTMTINPSSSVPVGVYTFTVQGTVTTATGHETHSASATLFVVPNNGFLLSVSPANQSIKIGDTATYLVTTHAAAGFAGTVNLSANPFAMGDTATFNPSAITGIGSSTMTVFASPNAPIGNFKIAIVGTSSGLPTATTTTGLVVTEVPNAGGCSVGVSINPPAPVAGDIVSYSGQLQGLTPTDTGNVTLTLDHQPLCTGANSCFVVQVPPPAGIHVVEWSCTSNGPSGSGSGSGTQIFNVGTVTPAGGISPKYVVLSVIYTPPGQKSTVDYGSSTMLGSSTSITDSFQVGGTLTASLGAPKGKGIDSNQDVPTSTRTRTLTEKLEDIKSIAINKSSTFDIQVPGLDNPTDGINHDYDVILLWLNPVISVNLTGNSTGQIPGYSFDASDPANEADVVPVYVKWLKDALKTPPVPLPPGIADSLARRWAVPPTDGTGTGLTANDFAQILKRDPFANGATTIDPKRFDLQAGETFAYEPPPNGGQAINQKFSLQYQTTSLLGQTATDAYQVGFSLGGSANVGDLNDLLKQTLKVAGSLTWSHSVQNQTTEILGQTATLSLTGPCFGYVGPTDVQVYQDNIYGTFMFSFVNPPTALDFSLCASPSLLTINTSDSKQYTISTSPINGFTSDVALTVSGLPAGVTGVFGSNPITGGAGSSLLTINVGPSAAAGTYSLLITATGGTITHTANITLTVNAVPDFSLSVSPGSQTINVGGSTTYTVSTAVFNGFNGSVALSQSGVPNGAVGAFSPASINGSGSSTLTVNTTTALPAGSYPITITGASGNLQQIVTATLVATTVPSACLSSGSLTFAGQNVGTTGPAQTLTLTSCGTAPLLITSITASGDFAQSNNCGSSLAPGTSCAIQITFTPAIPGSRTGSLNISDNAAGSPQSVNLSGAGLAPAASLSPASLIFAGQNLGTTSSAQMVTLTNSGTAALSVTSIAASGDFAQTNNCGATLAVGASCTVNVTFTPSAPGTRSGALSVTDNAAGSPQTVSLGGAGIGPTASLAPSSLTFGGQNVGTASAAQNLTLTNSGTAALTIASIALSGSGDFAQTNNCGATLAAGSSCTVNVTFTPSLTGIRNGTLSVADNAAGSPQTTSLSGTGTAPAASLAPASLTFAGQNIGTASAIKTVTLSNAGTGPLAIASIAASGDFTQTNNCGTTLVAGGSCSISVTFTPSAAGTRTGTLSVSDSVVGSPQTASLSGTGTVPVAGLAPSSLTFAGQNVGTTSAAQSLTLTNSGTGLLAIASIAASGDFAQTNNCGTTIVAGGSCAINVTFTPSATGTRSGTLSVSDNAAGSPQTAGLSGTGTAAGPSVLRPTTFTSPGTAYANPANATDGNLTTSADGIVNGGTSIEYWQGFGSAGTSPTQINLKISSAANCLDPFFDGNDGAEIAYSLDGGSTFHHIYAQGGLGADACSNRTQRTDVVSLPVSQNTAKVQVFAEVASIHGSSHQVYDIWIEVSH